ncbi:hypothetical protein V3C52_26810 [Escherichia coli]
MADSVLRTYRQYIHLLVNTFIGYLIAIAKQEKSSSSRSARLWLINVRDFPFVSSHANFPHTVDTWVIRAVWNTLQGNGYIDYPLPLKASDKLDDDLDLVNDADELEELVEDIAARCGRDLRGIEDNPFLPITTVGSLVSVLNAQPMTQERRSLLFTRS